ncbi:FtsK/SpoIIIE domain-containing protein [Bacillus seohaeanensis]|uniref:FtsK/SpoIIIE domain-containing protein n=1 Tax=Bacillus seohaeanensis TaxID=284580 RepID=A0ABW5RS35_9BACI
MNFKTTWAKLKTRKKLIDCFKSGGIHLTYEMSDKTKRLILPKIHSVDSTDNSTTIIFSLPNGLDPKLLQKHFYVFQQHFGKSIELEGEYKKYVLTIHHTSLTKSLKYNYEALSPLLSDLDVPIVCGKDSNGNIMVYDAITEPNCLISGEPGAGKSTQLRSILTTLIKYKSPDNLHIYLGDLKMSEFFLFKGIQHVKSVCIYPQDMARMLDHIHAEMKRRGELLNKHEATHVNNLPAFAKVPYIVLAIDEIVMIMDDKEMKKQLVQLVALGRALGIYCILSLQRPSHDILDTKIRGLLTVRMGFRTTDLSNSRIIGTPGSEKISRETPGRFLIKRDELTELQAPYLTESKAREILAEYKDEGWTDMFVGSNSPKMGGIKIEQLTEEDVFNDVK